MRPPIPILLVLSLAACGPKGDPTTASATPTPVGSRQRAFEAKMRDSPEEAAAFQAALQKYRADPDAFVFPEEARMFKVQAEAAVREKRLIDAADRFRKALAISPAWSAGHYNLALVFGELELHDLAIEEMKKYLLLSPDGENSRAAQDKIYVWQDKAAR